MTNFEVKYLPWPFPEPDFVRGYMSWVLLKDNIPLAAVANNNAHSDPVRIRYMASKEEGAGTLLGLGMMEKGLTIETGCPGNNEISASAYYLLEKMVRHAKTMGYKVTKLGRAFIPIKDYGVLHGKDIQHMRFEKV